MNSGLIILISVLVGIGVGAIMGLLAFIVKVKLNTINSRKDKELGKIPENKTPISFEEKLRNG